MSVDNPLLAGLKLPGRIFQLPSKGHFYKSGELADTAKNGEIHVKALSALDEITLKNADQLFSGNAVNTVLPKCIEGLAKPSNLLSKDVDAILLFLRTVTYGPTYEFTAKHTCENAKEHTYTADLEKIIMDMKYIDPTIVDDQYSITLQNSQVVKLKPLEYGNVMSIVKNNQNKTELTVEDAKKNLKDLILGVVESVDNTVNFEHIKQWVEQLPSPYVNRIAQKFESLADWGVDTIVECTCKDCGQIFKAEIALNPVTFFTE